MNQNCSRKLLKSIEKSWVATIRGSGALNNTLEPAATRNLHPMTLSVVMMPGTTFASKTDAVLNNDENCGLLCTLFGMLHNKREAPQTFESLKNAYMRNTPHITSLEDFKVECQMVRKAGSPREGVDERRSNVEETVKERLGSTHQIQCRKCYLDVPIGNQSCLQCNTMLDDSLESNLEMFTHARSTMSLQNYENTNLNGIIKQTVEEQMFGGLTTTFDLLPSYSFENIGLKQAARGSKPSKHFSKPVLPRNLSLADGGETISVIQLYLASILDILWPLESEVLDSKGCFSAVKSIVSIQVALMIIIVFAWMN